MTHLSEIEVVDLVEGVLAADRMRHVDACPACREQAEALGAVLRLARDDEIAGPSPLFWDYLSARVAETIAIEPAPRRAAVLAIGRWRLATAAVLMLLVAGVAWQISFTRDRASNVGPGQPSAEQTPADSGVDSGVEDSLDAWEALEAMASDLEWEDAQAIGIASRPGSAEPLVDDLTAEERAELVRLIEEEMKRQGA